MDFPSADPTVRLVLLLQVFLSESASIAGIAVGVDTPQRNFVANCQEKIESIGLSPVKRTDLVEVLSNKFAPERFRGILEYGSAVLGMSEAEIKDLVQEVAFKCLEIGCKGKMLDKMVGLYTFLKDAIRVHVVKTYRLDIADLPPSEDLRACQLYEAPLCQDFVMPRITLPDTITGLMQRTPEVNATGAGSAQTVSSGDGQETGEDSHSKIANDDDDDDNLVRKRS